MEIFMWVTFSFYLKTPHTQWIYCIKCHSELVCHALFAVLCVVAAHLLLPLVMTTICLAPVCFCLELGSQQALSVGLLFLNVLRFHSTAIPDHLLFLLSDCPFHITFVTFQ